MNQIVSRLAIPILFGALMLSGCGGGEKTATNGGKEKAAENKTVTIGVTPEYPKKLKLVINKQAAEKQGIKLKPSFTEPSILLLDEHTAALDPARAELITNLTKEIVERYRLTTLMVTHNMQQAIELGNRLIMMDKGQIILEVDEAEKKRLTVEKLLAEFRRIRGEQLASDRAVLS
ncbi:ABC transporter ATP-binding protein [Geobacillus sp. GHH01]|nr:ABC transporter ATP-binding protein [Geobacillus sp. GHH01]